MNIIELSEFDRIIIEEAKKIGLTDEEIQQWLMEI